MKVRYDPCSAQADCSLVVATSPASTGYDASSFVNQVIQQNVQGTCLRSLQLQQAHVLFFGDHFLAGHMLCLQGLGRPLTCTEPTIICFSL